MIEYSAPSGIHVSTNRPRVRGTVKPPSSSTTGERYNLRFLGAAALLGGGLLSHGELGSDRRRGAGVWLQC